MYYFTDMTTYAPINFEALEKEDEENTKQMDEYNDLVKLFKVMGGSDIIPNELLHLKPNGFIKADQADFHSWIQLKDKKLDYSEANLRKCSPIIPKECLGLKYVPYDDDVQELMLGYWRDRFLQVIKKCGVECGMTYDELITHILKKPYGMCMYRCLILSTKLIEKNIPHKIVFGALGFKMNGIYHYEYG